jgi:uncharacterized protein with GYD domain
LGISEQQSLQITQNGHLRVSSIKSRSADTSYYRAIDCIDPLRKLRLGLLTGGKMTWSNWLKTSWTRDGLFRSVVLGITANVLSGPVLYGLKEVFPNFEIRLLIPIWLLVWIVGVIPVLTLLPVLIFRGATASNNRLRGSDRQEYDAHEEGGEAYVLFEVEPEFSDAIARELSEREGVRFAAAVWGQWDVIARVQVGTARALVRFLNQVQADDRILRTETQIVRNDQPQVHATPREDHFAFLLLKLPAKRTQHVLDQLRNLESGSDIAKVQHASGILGRYDIALTVRYSRDEELTKLVMQYAQRTLQAETTTMPAIRGMTYVDGKAA